MPLAFLGYNSLKAFKQQVSKLKRNMQQQVKESSPGRGPNSVASYLRIIAGEGPTSLHHTSGRSHQINSPRVIQVHKTVTRPVINNNIIIGDQAGLLTQHVTRTFQVKSDGSSDVLNEVYHSPTRYVINNSQSTLRGGTAADRFFPSGFTEKQNDDTRLLSALHRKRQGTMEAVTAVEWTAEERNADGAGMEMANGYERYRGLLNLDGYGNDKLSTRGIAGDFSTVMHGDIDLLKTKARQNQMEQDAEDERLVIMAYERHRALQESAWQHQRHLAEKAMDEAETMQYIARYRGTSDGSKRDDVFREWSNALQAKVALMIRHMEKDDQEVEDKYQRRYGPYRDEVLKKAKEFKEREEKLVLKDIHAKLSARDAYLAGASYRRGTTTINSGVEVENKEGTKKTTSWAKKSDSELNAAATKIQQRFRGHQQRKKMEQQLDEDNARLLVQLQAKKTEQARAATRIQQQFRGHQQRRKMQQQLDEDNARLLAQLQARRDEQTKAATRIQQQFRGFKERKNMAQKLEEENARFLAELKAARGASL